VHKGKTGQSGGYFKVHNKTNKRQGKKYMKTNAPPKKKNITTTTPPPPEKGDTRTMKKGREKIFPIRADEWGSLGEKHHSQH